MPQQKMLLQVFVASPGDTQEERIRLEAVVGELNRGIGSTGALYLELVKWETHARPAAGRPQQVVFDTTTSPDILIGIFSQRLGTPTGLAASGTVEEIENALSFWRQYQGGRAHRIEIMLYFKQPPFDVRTEDDIEQLGLVRGFRQRVSQELLVWDYEDADDFEGSARGHLARLVQDWNEDSGQKERLNGPSGRSYWAIQLERILSALEDGDDADTLARDAAQYIRMAANAHGHGLDYDDLVRYCDELLRHLSSSPRVDVLVMRGDIERLAGRWQAAYRSFLEAADAARADDTPADEAEVLRHLARLTWEHGLLSRDLVDRCERLLRDLPEHLVEQRAMVGVILADRLAFVPRAQRRRHQLAANATARAEEIVNPEVRADILLAARQALYDDEPTSALYEYAVRVERIGHELRDVHLISEGLGGQIVDLLRQRNMTAARATLKRHRQLCSLTAGRPQLFRQLTIETLIALAEGQFDRADETARRGRDILSGILSAEDNASVSDVAAAQEGWCLYERGDAKLRPFIVRLVQHLGEGVPGSEDVWRLGVALASIDIGDVESGLSIFHDVVRTTARFSALERGLFRVGTLALGAEVVWALALAQGADAELRITAHTIALNLDDHGDDGVLLGFPAIFLGDKRRFLGVAHVCAGNVDEGHRCLEMAAHFNANAGLLALEARCLHDLAQVAALRDRPAEAEAHLRKATERARELGMRRLAQRPLRETLV
jgi:tetratricopeptide (TPR) repeat protein